MRIVIATGIFEPESGGPATYTPKLATRLIEAGHEVTVITYSDQARFDFDTKYSFKLVRVVRGNRLFNRVKFLAAVMQYARACDLIYTLDWFAAGVPVLIAARLRRIKYIVRVGGDYLWEQKYLDKGEDPVPLSDFYEQGIYARAAYRPFFLTIKAVLTNAAHVVFNSDIQRDLYVRFYGIAPARTSTIYNPLSRKGIDVRRDGETHELLFWGRLERMNNIDSLIRAFARAHLPDDYTLAIIGNGVQREYLSQIIAELNIGDRVTMSPRMRQHEAWERVKNARAFILPTWTAISPNQVCEALAIGLPTLVTQDNYLSFRDQLPDMIDPRSIDDIAAKLEMLADDAKYEEFKKRCAAVTFDTSWEDVTAQHLALFESIASSKFDQNMKIVHK